MILISYFFGGKAMTHKEVTMDFEKEIFELQKIAEIRILEVSRQQAVLTERVNKLKNFIVNVNTFRPDSMPTMELATQSFNSARNALVAARQFIESE